MIRSDLAAGTVVAKSYLPFARVLAQSFKLHHPDIPFLVLLADEVDGYFDPACEPFDLVRLSDLEIPALERFRFHYAQQPLSYASTPHFLSHLLKRGFSRVVFLKQETLILGSLDPLFELLASASIVLTPHVVSPLGGDDRHARELNILQSGVFNVGLLGVSDSSETRRFLGWWQDRVHMHCRHAVGDGMHYEQRWLDLAPAMFDGVRILRDPSYNVGHWNLPDRNVDVQGDAVFVDRQPCRVFRFSGYDPDHPTVVTRYNGRLSWDNVGPARWVFERFRRALEDAGFRDARDWPFTYGRFDNGVPVPDAARALYLTMEDDVARFGDPLQTTSPNSYFRWLNGDGARECDKRTPTRFWQAIHDARPDLHDAFPDIFGADREAFLDWIVRSGFHEHHIPSAFPPCAETST